VFRALVNLLVNAQQGDGRRGAQRCEVRAEVSDQRIVVDVEDDGPGFAPQLLSAVPAPGLTTKPEGSGLGLAFVHAMLDESGGGIERTNLAAGARVRLAFPRGPEGSSA
jgi:C4-dicarboxylate-specific signal transduction histidine kinase